MSDIRLESAYTWEGMWYATKLTTRLLEKLEKKYKGEKLKELKAKLHRGGIRFDTSNAKSIRLASIEDQGLVPEMDIVVEWITDRVLKQAIQELINGDTYLKKLIRDTITYVKDDLGQQDCRSDRKKKKRWTKILVKWWALRWWKIDWNKVRLVRNGRILRTWILTATLVAELIAWAIIYKDRLFSQDEVEKLQTWPDTELSTTAGLNLSDDSNDVIILPQLDEPEPIDGNGPDIEVTVDDELEWLPDDTRAQVLGVLDSDSTTWAWNLDLISDYDVIVNIGDDKVTDSDLERITQKWRFVLTIEIDWEEKRIVIIFNNGDINEEYTLERLIKWIKLSLNRKSDTDPDFFDWIEDGKSILLNIRRESEEGDYRHPSWWKTILTVNWTEIIVYWWDYNDGRADQWNLTNEATVPVWANKVTN